MLESPVSYFLGDTNTDGVFDADDLQGFLSHTNLEADWRTK